MNWWNDNLHSVYRVTQWYYILGYYCWLLDVDMLISVQMASLATYFGLGQQTHRYFYCLQGIIFICSPLLHEMITFAIFSQELRWCSDESWSSQALCNSLVLGNYLVSKAVRLAFSWLISHCQFMVSSNFNQLCVSSICHPMSMTCSIASSSCSTVFSQWSEQYCMQTNG